MRFSGDPGDWVVRGTLAFDEDGYRWKEHLLDGSTAAGERRHWLSVEEGESGLELVLWDRLPGSDLTPDSAGSALFGWLMVGLGQQVGFPVPEGGAERLTDALVGRLTAAGGVVRTGCRVQRIVVEDDPGLVAGVSALAGEGRFRQLYVDDEPPRRVAERWRDRLGNLAWVRTRDEAVEQGWFGDVDPDLAERYGHVLVAMRFDWAVMTRQYPREFELVGMHGSLTAAEMEVPLLVD